MSRSTASELPHIALISSNARQQYFADCLRALMLPRGMVLHFRYRTKYVDPSLLSKITAGSIAGHGVVVCYAFQGANSGAEASNIEGIRPIRRGTIIDAEIVGPTVHLYFTVDGYPSHGDAASEIAHAVAERQRLSEVPLFAAVIHGLGQALFSTGDADATAFAAMVDSFEEGDLQLTVQSGARENCDPLFMRVDGLYSRPDSSKSVRLIPTLTPPFSNRERGYIVTTPNPLELHVQFYQPRWSSVANAGLSIELKVDEEFIASSDRLEIRSPYDQAEFSLFQDSRNGRPASRIELLPVRAEGKQQSDHIMTQGFTFVVSRQFKAERRSVPNFSLASNLLAILISAVAALASLRHRR
jgi:hypothetical protein